MMVKQDSAGRAHPPRQDRSRQTHRAILVATETLMAERPFDSISIAEIAASAGVSVGNFYNRFSDKTALLMCLFDELEQDRADYLKETFELSLWQGQPLETRATEIVRLLVDFFWSRRAVIRSFVLYYRVNDVGKTLGPRLRSFSGAGTLILLDAMTDAKDSEMRVELGLQTVIALCREFILFGGEPSKKAMGLSRKALTGHMVRVLMGCLNEPG